VEDKNYTGGSYGAAFAPDGHLYTVAFDGKLRRYGPPPHFKKEREMATKASKEPFSVTVDPDGKLVAVGFNNTQGVEIYSASTLAYRFGGDIKGFDNGDLSKVAWSGDGARLVAGGTFESLNQGAWKRPLVTFGRDGKRRGALLPLSDNTIENLKPCGDAMAVAAADPAFGLVDGRGQISLWKTGVAPDLRGKLGEAFTIASNAKRVRIGLGDDADDPVLFNFDQLTLTGAPNPVPGLMKPVVEGLQISNWKNDFHPTLSGRPIAIEQYEMSRSIAIRPDRSGFIVGADFNLYAFDAEGRQLWQRPNPAAAWGVNISADGRIIVVAYRDGTIRWHRWSDGRELLALFINRKTKTWVAWTPSGYYLASPGGETLIGWLVNRGWNQPADFFPASQFANKYARQDIVNRVLDTLDEQEAVRLADRSNSANKVVAPIIETLPPVLSILSPADNTHVAGTSLTVTYIVRSPSGLRLDTVGVLINDQPSGARSTGDDTEVKRCIEETHGLGRAEGALQGCRGSLTVEISPGSTQIGVFAKAGGKTSTMATARVTR
jgi:WD40 repeat protein